MDSDSGDTYYPPFPTSPTPRSSREGIVDSPYPFIGQVFDNDSDGDEEPPRRRARLNPPTTTTSPRRNFLDALPTSPLVFQHNRTEINDQSDSDLRLLNCEVRVPRISVFTNFDTPGHEPTPGSSTGPSRMMTRAQSSMYLAAENFNPSNSGGPGPATDNLPTLNFNFTSPRRTNNPQQSQPRQEQSGRGSAFTSPNRVAYVRMNDISLDSNNSNSSGSRILARQDFFGFRRIPDAAADNPNSGGNTVEQDVQDVDSGSESDDADELAAAATHWNRRRLVRRNAIIQEEVWEPDVVDDDEDGDIIVFNPAAAEVSSDASDAPSPFPEAEFSPGSIDSVASFNSATSVTSAADHPLVVEIMDAQVPIHGNTKMSSEIVSGSSRKLDDSMKSSGDDDEGLTCLICYEPFTNSGEHRLTCLKCGHTYGKACIEKWIRNERRCPQCNAKAVAKDIRILYVKNLKALDTVERDKLLADLEMEREWKRKLELECARLRQNNQNRELVFQRQQTELVELRQRIGGIYRDPTTSVVETTPVAKNGLKTFAPLKYLEFKDGDLRVGAYNQWLNMTAISQTLKNALYPQGCFGIKRINMLDLRVMQTTPIHQKEIRDLQFSTLQNDLLLSVGLDKKAMLTNCQNNVVVQTFQAPHPLWSCTWNRLCQHLLYVGTMNGQVMVYDLRNPQESVKVLTIPTEDSTPVANMHFITPTYQNNSFNLSGLLIQKLNSCWFCEIRNEKEIFHQLPVEGSFTSIDFEYKSRLMLISTRPSAKSPTGKHMVSELHQYFSEAQDCNVCSCNIVQTYEGGQTGVGKMVRSSIFSPEDGTVLVGANGGKNFVNIWNVSDVNTKRSLCTRDTILDFLPCQVNDNFLLGMVTANGLHVNKYV